MKLVKQASGKTTIKMSRKEWTDLGKKAGWMKKADSEDFRQEEQRRKSLAAHLEVIIGRWRNSLDTEQKAQSMLAPNGQPSKYISGLLRDAKTIEKYDDTILDSQDRGELRLVNCAAYNSLIYTCEQVLSGNTRDLQYLPDKANRFFIWMEELAQEIRQSQRYQGITQNY